MLNLCFKRSPRAIGLVSTRSNVRFSSSQLAACLLLAFPLAALAQSATDSVLQPVVVTAARVPQAQTDALPHTTLITREQIVDSQASDLPTLLRREAGIEFSQAGGPGQPTSFFMRGAQPGQTLVLIDGVPVRRQDFATAPALEHILPNQIDHIEIVRGNVSAIYGSGAIGGVVQIFTRQGSGPASAVLSLEAGSRGTFNSNASISGASGATRYALALTRFTTQGISANSTAQFPNENPDRDGNRNSSISGSVTHAWQPGQEIGFNLYANDGRYEFDGGGFGARNDVNNGRSQQRSLAVFSKNRFDANWLSTVTLSQTATRSRSRSISAFGYDVGDDGDTSLLQWVNQINLTHDWIVNAGIDLARERLDAIDSGVRTGYDRSTSSAYVGLNGKFGAHQLQANLRHDRVGGAGSDSTGYLGYGFALTPTFKLSASLSNAFNAPTLLQIYDPFYGNRNLHAERSRSYELGAQWSAGGSLLRATWFDTRVRDQFGYDPSTFQTVNIERARNRGVELSASGKLADIDLRASLTLQNPVDESSGARLVRRAHTLASIGAAKNFGAWNVGGDLQYTGNRVDTIGQLGAYWLANLNARYAINTSWSVFGRIDNLFDRHYQTVYGYDQLPFGAFIGVRWQP